MAINTNFEIVPNIIRFCENPKNKDRIMTRLNLNDVQVHAYLAILTQSLLVQNNGKYVITMSGKSYIYSIDRSLAVQTFF